MSLETSSKRYAKALIGYGVEKDNLDILFSEFSSLIQTLEDSKDLVSFIHNPTISKDIKQKVLDELISDNLPNTLIVINLLSQNNRLDMLLDVCKGFIEQYNVHKDIVEVIVTTPIEISEDIENSIQAYLNSIENGKIKLVKKRDESLIAGFTIDYNNTRLDASVKRRLEKMKKQLKKTN
jgi:ATP synthase F1 delta subunit